MVYHSTTERRATKTLRIAVLGGACVAVWQLVGKVPSKRLHAFTVKGVWNGIAPDLTSLPKGLGPDIIDGGAIAEEDAIKGGPTTGLTVGVAGGHMALDFVEGALVIHADDTKKWTASYDGKEAQLTASGEGGDKLVWSIAKKNDVKGLGAVDVKVNSDPKSPFELVVVPDLPKFKETDLEIKIVSHGKEVQGTLNAARELTKGVNLAYSIANEEGKYDFDRFVHNVLINAQLDKDSQALFTLVGDMKQQNFNASITTDLSSQLSSKSHDADAVLTVGFDNGGLYGSFIGNRSVGQGFTAAYDVSGRVPSKKSAKKQVSEKITMTNGIVSATLTQATGEQTTASVAFDVNEGPLAAKGSITQVIGNKLMPSYKIALTRGLGDVLGPGAEAFLLVDDLSLDGVSGRLTWKHELQDSDATIEYESKGPLKSLEHSLKLANDLGYLLVTKAEKAEPKIQIGYQFDV